MIRNPLTSGLINKNELLSRLSKRHKEIVDRMTKNNDDMGTALVMTGQAKEVEQIIKIVQEEFV